MFKMMSKNKIITVGISLILIICLSACNFSEYFKVVDVPISIGGKETVAPTIPPSPEPTKGPEHKFKRGKTEDNVYTNEYLGFSFKLPHHQYFYFYSDAQIASEWKYTGELMKTPEGVYDILDRKGFTDMGAYGFDNSINFKMNVAVFNNGTEDADLKGFMDQINPDVVDEYGSTHENLYNNTTDIRTIAGIDMLHRTFGGNIQYADLRKWKKEVFLYTVDFYIVAISYTWVGDMNDKIEDCLVFEDCFTPVK